MRWLWRALKATARVAPLAVAVIGGALRFAPYVLHALGAVLVVASTLQLLRARVRAKLRRYRGHPEVLAAIALERRAASRSLVGALLLAVAPLWASPLVVAVAGAFAAVVMVAGTVSANGRSVLLQQRRGLGRGMGYVNELPTVVAAKERAATAPTLVVTRWFVQAFGDGRSAGEIGGHLAKTVGAVLVVGLAYVAVAMACTGAAVVKEITKNQGRSSQRPATAGRGHGHSAPQRPTEEDVSYADQCPQLPDPLAIGHGLGELFRRDGATQAGCGQLAEQVAPDVWVSRGECGGDLRSFAVVAPGQPPVLLYGEPAGFAEVMGAELRAAERAQPGGGEVALVTATHGTYAFTRSTPALGAAVRHAHRCTEVSEPARPFVRLVPAMGELWAQYVQRHGWAWPSLTATTGGYALRDAATDQIVGSGDCTTAGTCRLGARRGVRWTMAGEPVLEMVALRPAMP